MRVNALGYASCSGAPRLPGWSGNSPEADLLSVQSLPGASPIIWFAMATDGGGTPQTTLYERVGGDDYFHSLVDRFYEGVEADPVLRPLYPEDLQPALFHLAEFLV